MDGTTSNMTEITDTRIDKAIERKAFVEETTEGLIGNRSISARGIEDARDFALEIRRLRKREEDARGLLEKLEGLVGSLWDIIDEIDTASDMAKDDNVGYRKAVEDLQKWRWKTGITIVDDKIVLPPDCAVAKWLEGE